MEHLQLLQRETVCGIVQLFDPPLNSDDDDDDYHGQVHVGMFMKLGGVFWKNPRILEDYELMTDVLQVLQKASLLMLLPHLEEWTRRYAVPGNPNARGGLARFNLRRDRGCRVFHDATFRIGGGGSFSVEVESPDIKIFTIDGLSPVAIDDWDVNQAISPRDLYQRQAVRNILLRANYPVLQLVEDSEPHTWWVFGLGRGMFDDRWFLVNFEQRIFWNCSMGGVICVWHEICTWSLDCWELVRAFDRHGPMREIWDVLLNYMTYGQKRIDGRGNGEQDESTESDLDGDEDDDDEPESDGTSDIVDSSSAFETFSKAFG